MTLSEKQFGHWLSAYGRAWEAKNARGFADLFADNALYYWTPFLEPQKGRAEIAAAFIQAVGRQRDIDFGARVLYVNDNAGAAHWSCAFTRANTGKRVHVDGMLGARFDQSAKAISFREWWHSDEG
jgi:hypothetical protein